MRAAGPERAGFRCRPRATRTDAERRLWSRLRDRRLGHCTLERQETTAAWIGDACGCTAGPIVAAAGGPQAGHARVRIRDAFLSDRGHRLLRFRTAAAPNNTVGVLDTIRAALPASPRLR